MDYTKKICLKHSRALVSSHYGYVCEACESAGYRDDVITADGLIL